MNPKTERLKLQTNEKSHAGNESLNSSPAWPDPPLWPVSDRAILSTFSIVEWSRFNVSFIS